MKEKLFDSKCFLSLQTIEFFTEQKPLKMSHSQLGEFSFCLGFRQNEIKPFSRIAIMELLAGIGPATPTLPRWCSTSEPQ